MFDAETKKIALAAGFTKADCATPELATIINKFAWMVRRDERGILEDTHRKAINEVREDFAKACERLAKSIRRKKS